MAKIVNYLREHKLKLSVFLIVAAGIGYYFFQKNSNDSSGISYMLGTAQKGAIIVSVSGSGQVSSVNQVDLKAESSGKIRSLNIKNGQEVRAGEVIAALDQKDSLLSITQAKAALLSARTNYQKVLDGATADDIKLSQLSVEQAGSSLASAKTDLENTKLSAEETVAQAEKNLRDLRDISNSSADNKRDQVIITAEGKINAAKNYLDHIKKIMDDKTAENTLSVLNMSMKDLMKVNYDSARSLLAAANTSLIMAKSSKTDANLSQVVNDALNLLDKTDSALDYGVMALENSVSSASFSQSSIDSYKATLNSDTTAVGAAISALKTDWQNLKDAITKAENALSDAKLASIQQVAAGEAKVTSAQKSLENANIQFNKIIAPAAAASVESARVQVINAEAQLLNAQNNLAKTVVKSPIDGIIAETAAKTGDDVTSATIIATIITPNNIAEVSLNEVDVARTKVGQKAALSFSAIDGLEISGTVSYINPIGTVSQGVVSYSVKVVFDIQDERIKPGMSVSASIITDQKHGVITVSNSAVKIDSSGSYVQMLGDRFDAAQIEGLPVQTSSAPIRIGVVTGLSDETNTEIASGLKEGDKIVVNTIGNSNAGAAGTTQAGNRSGFNSGPVSGGQFFRVIGR